MHHLSKSFGMSGSLGLTTRKLTQALSRNDGRKLIQLVFLLLIVCLFSLPALGQYGGGNGTADDPYLIDTPEQMNAIGANSLDWFKHFKLTADIDLSGYMGTAFNIIGNFSGIFDGNSHTISNFTYSSTGTDANGIGLFRSVGPNAKVKDLGLIDPNIDVRTAELVGSLVGYLGNGTLSACYVEGGSVSGKRYVGGLVGRSLQGRITNCDSTASVWADGEVGGLVGYTVLTIINNCYATGEVSGSENAIGGLVGVNNGDVSNCYATGSVEGSGTQIGGLVGHNSHGTISKCACASDVLGVEHVGGLVGENSADGVVTRSYSSASVWGGWLVGGLAGLNYGEVSNCYATGNIKGADRVGGLVGENIYDDWSSYYGTIGYCYATGSVTGLLGDIGDVGGLLGNNSYEGVVKDCFWDMDTSGLSNMCGYQDSLASGCNDGNGKTTAEMHMASTFTSAAWDFVGESTNGRENIWRLCGAGTDYPKLAWQFLLGDLDCPDGVDVNDLAVFVEQWLRRVLSANVATGGPDETVNFLDWAVFAAAWQSSPSSPNWNEKCDIAPEDGDGIVNIDDLAVFCDQWPRLSAWSADIAPDGGDGVVNMLDFAALAENWRAGL